MAAYIIVLREGPIVNAEAYAEYQRKNREQPPRLGLARAAHLRLLAASCAAGQISLTVPDEARIG